MREKGARQVALAAASKLPRLASARDGEGVPGALWWCGPGPVGRMAVISIYIIFVKKFILIFYFS